MENTKICSKCKETKDLTEFPKNIYRKSGFGSWCKICKNKDGARYRKEHPRTNIWPKTIDGRVKTRLNAIRYKCKTNNIPFNITKDDIIVPTHCPILGLSIEYGNGKVTDNSPSVDRIKPELGYIKGNVIIVSNRVNRIKQDATLEELNKIASFYKQFTK